MPVLSLPRRFIIGKLKLNDPLPDGSLDEVHAVLSQDHPNLRHTHIFESDGGISECGAYIDYHVVLQPVKTNG
jgi:hypothetical protein